MKPVASPYREHFSGHFRRRQNLQVVKNVEYQPAGSGRKAPG